MYLNKIIETDPYLISKTGTIEKTVRIIGEGADFSHDKIASAALDYSRSVRSKPGSTYILVLAMGASEFYGPNRNGDAFRESELKEHYKTFETNANVFKSHVNKDPEKRVGLVTKAFYNDIMHRVELILELIDSKCSDIVAKIRANQDVAVSMGCRIKYDVCTICGNKAPTRADYCKHLKYELNDIYPDGRIVAADNPAPKFFDISMVWRPADKIGYMMKKVASRHPFGKGASSASQYLKTAAKSSISKYLNKAAEIDKIILGVGVNPKSISQDEHRLSVQWLKTIAPKMISSYNRLSDETIKDLSKREFSSVLKGLADKDIFLMTPEFLDLIFQKVLGCAAPSGLASKMVQLQSSIFDLLSKNPESSSEIIEEGVIDPKAVPSQDLEKKLSSVTRQHTYRSTEFRPSMTSLINSEEGIKVAGLAAKTYAVYSAMLLDSCNAESTVKLAHIVDPDYIPSSFVRNKLSYLLNRSSDIYCNTLKSDSYGTIKISSRLPTLYGLSLDDAGYSSDLELGYAILNS